MIAIVRRRWLVLATAASAALAGSALGAALALRTPYGRWQGEGVTVELPHGLGAREMLERLHQAGVLRRPGVLRAWLVLRGGAQDLQAGEYRFEQPLSPLEVLDKLLRGDVLLHAVTLPEGLDMEEVARRMAEAGLCEAPKLLAVLRQPGSVREIDPAASDLEGYLFPDTYRLPRGETPERIARTLVDRFREVTGSGYAETAAAAGLSLREAVTLASLIEKETSLPEERPRISRVFHNRLRAGMRLQCDPTVLYALKRDGRPVAGLTADDLEFDSPWNTYRVHGLPPGPICSPGRDSLRAAVQPAHGDELYFVARPEGGHQFSRDLASHLLAVRRWRDRQRSSR